MDINQAKVLRRLVGEYVEAAINASWAGALPPEERGPILAIEAKARRNLMQYIRDLSGASQRIGS